jgi:hypothetical protein
MSRYGSNLVIEPPVNRGALGAHSAASWPSVTGQLLSNPCVELLMLVLLCGLVAAPVVVLLLLVSIDRAGGTVSAPVLCLGVRSAAAMGTLSLLCVAHNLRRPLRCRESPQWKPCIGVAMRPLELAVFIGNALGALTVEFSSMLAVSHFAAAVATVHCGLTTAPWGLSAPGLETLGWRITVGLGIVQAATSLWLGATVQYLAGAASIRNVFVSAMLPVPPGTGGKVSDCGSEHPTPAAGRSSDRDVPYGPEPEQRLDIYRSDSQPVGRDSCPVAVFVHGGGWISGDKQSADSYPMLVELRRQGWVIPTQFPSICCLFKCEASVVDVTFFWLDR